MKAHLIPWVLVLAALLDGGAGPSTAPPAAGTADPVAGLSDGQVHGIVQPRERRPTAVLLLTARGVGEIEPCGCHARPGGGLARRAGFARLVGRVWPEVPMAWLSAGDFSAPPGPAAGLRTRSLAFAMKKMGYAAANVGPGELVAGLEGYRSDVVSSGLRLLTSNLEARPDPLAEGEIHTSMDAALQRTLDLGGLRIGLLGLSALPRPVPGILARNPARAAEAAAGSMRPSVDFLLALGALPERTALAVARAVPSLDLVYAGSGSRITPQPVRVGEVPVILGGDRGLWVTEVRLYAGTEGLEAAEFVTHYLGDEVPEDPALLEVERAIAAEVRKVRREEAARAAAARPGREEGGYSGAGACRPCHREAWRRWRGSGHARAFATLEERGREFEPECLPCHVTGSGSPGGFSNPVRDRGLAGVQCEACHGAGADHIRDPSAPWPGPSRDRCSGCHDADNDPGFDPKRAWETIRH